MHLVICFQQQAWVCVFYFFKEQMLLAGLSLLPCYSRYLRQKHTAAPLNKNGAARRNS